MLRKFRQNAEKKQLVAAGQRTLLAVSGGVDSVVMAHLFFRCGYRFGIAHCNFSLRGAESDGDELFTRHLANQFNVPFFSRTFATRDHAIRNRCSIQMAARELRYTWLEEIREQEGFDRIATAHHLDDQAETFIINLIRGTGIAGLHGISDHSGRLIRPMMFGHRWEISAYARHHEIQFREDHTNVETKYIRNRIRHEILPALEKINPGLSDKLSATIRYIQQTEALANLFLEDFSRQHVQVSGEIVTIRIEALMESKQRETIAWSLLSPFGFSSSQVENLVFILDDPEEKVFLSATHRCRKERSRLVVEPLMKNDRPPECHLITLEGNQFSMDSPVPLRFQLSPVDNTPIPKDRLVAVINADKLHFPLMLRKWRHGDVFQPFGMQGKKKISDFFTDLKLSQSEKEQTWLLCNGSDIIWVVGHRIDHRYRITRSVTTMLTVQIH